MMIKMARLITGDVLVAETTEFDDGSISVVRPALMQMQILPPKHAGDSATIGVGMVPYQPWVDEPMVFKATSLLGPVNDVDDNTRRGYNERFNPDALIMPETSGIILG